MCSYRHLYVAICILPFGHFLPFVCAETFAESINNKRTSEIASDISADRQSGSGDFAGGDEERRKGKEEESFSLCRQLTCFQI